MLQKLNPKLHGRARVLVLDGVPILQVHIISQNARRRQAMDDTVHAMRITKRHGPLGIHRNGDMLSPSRCRGRLDPAAHDVPVLRIPHKVRIPPLTARDIGIELAEEAVFVSLEYERVLGGGGGPEHIVDEVFGGPVG